VKRRGSEERRPQRTCIGCRGVFSKEQVIRIVAGPAGAVIDYREKLPGRAAYVCPRPGCIERALHPGTLSRALRMNVTAPAGDRFRADLAAAIRDKIASLVSMATRAGMAVSGYSAVEDALRKSRVLLLLFASDLSAGTREKVLHAETGAAVRRATVGTKESLGKMTGRDQAGIVGILDEGFSNALWRETERLKGLPNSTSVE
jgi:uncharacterized protein